MKIFKGIMFWLWSLTWGCLMTIAGLFVALALLITGHRPYLYHWYIRFEAGGNNWGGFSCGPIIVTDKTPIKSLMQHEAGHGLQNLILGPLMPFVVSLPSALRYWFRELTTDKGRVWYIVLVFFAFMLIAAVPVPFALIYHIEWLMAITGAIIVYGCIITGWQLKEYPKYKGRTNHYPDYDSFFAEGWATRWGNKYFGKK